MNDYKRNTSNPSSNEPDADTTVVLWPPMSRVQDSKENRLVKKSHKTGTGNLSNSRNTHPTIDYLAGE